MSPLHGVDAHFALVPPPPSRDSFVLLLRLKDLKRPFSGGSIFNNACRTCHSIREGDNRLGPHMRGIIGRKAGSLPNYSYSSAMRGANFIWDEENLGRTRKRWAPLMQTQKEFSCIQQLVKK
jgi:hypothetical protein